MSFTLFVQCPESQKPDILKDLWQQPDIVIRVVSKKKESSAHIKFYLRQLFYGPTLNFFYVCTLLVYFLMNSWHVMNLTAPGLWVLRCCSGTGFVCPPAGEPGQVWQRKWDNAKQPKAGFYKIKLFFNNYFFLIINSFSLQREVRVEHTKFAIQAIK